MKYIILYMHSKARLPYILHMKQTIFMSWNHAISFFNFLRFWVEVGVGGWWLVGLMSPITLQEGVVLLLHSGDSFDSTPAIFELKGICASSLFTSNCHLHLFSWSTSLRDNCDLISASIGNWRSWSSAVHEMIWTNAWLDD